MTVTSENRVSTRHGKRGGPVRRWRGLVLVLAAAVALAGCDAPRPDVTFYANRHAVDTGPTRWCTVDTAAQSVACTEADAAAVPRLTAAPGKPVQVNVPAAIGHEPWALYFRYLTKDGTLADGRTEIFSDSRLAYTLTPFAATDQLTYVEVQTGFVLMGGAQSGVDFAVTRSWLLLVDPPAAPSTPGAG